MGQGRLVSPTQTIFSSLCEEVSWLALLPPFFPLLLCHILCAVYIVSMHHACYVEGPLTLFEPYREHIRPFWAEQFEKFGIEEARALVEQAQLKAAGDVTFFVAAGSLTTEAQQALLKLFEEPRQGLRFVLLVPHGVIIPTLRSRMMPYSDVLEEANNNTDAKKFLKSSSKDRSAYIAKLLKSDDNAREVVQALLNDLEVELAKGLTKAKGNKTLINGLEDIAKVRSYTNDRAPALKMLLEHLALALPQV